jgi:hypothetical protein
MIRGDYLVVDVRATTGALVIYAPEAMAGREIEIARDGAAPGHPVHNVIRPRRVGTEILYAAVFPALPAGRYGPYRQGTTGELFSIVGGKVTEIEWPYAA